jgi:pseudaminic acid cytidylyltransferase
MTSRLALIPARGGSKRIPRKNIRPFAGKPIIAHPIAAAIASGCFDEIMVSTDDDEIAAVAKDAGASVPFRRDASLSNDFATTVDVVLDVLKSFEQRGKKFDQVCCLYPTSVFATPELLREGRNTLENGNFDSCSTLVKFGHPVQRALVLQDGLVAFRWPENRSARTQDLEPHFHDGAQFYWVKVPAVVRERSLFTARCTAVLLEERRVQDLDTLEDWEIAEMKFARVSKN